jgi:hypothetical protein
MLARFLHAMERDANADIKGGNNEASLALSLLTGFIMGSGT